jgi:hypothetical protein
MGFHQNRAGSPTRRKRPFLKPLWVLSAYSRAAEYLLLKRIRQMLIVDGQIHLWEKGTPSRWSSYPYLSTPILSRH